MTIVEVNSIFEEGKVIIPIQEDADIFFQGGYGMRLDNRPGLILNPWESLYLLADKRIKVIDSESEDILDFQSLFERFITEDVEIWTKYLIYRDLRKRGYVVKEGTGWGVTFRFYNRGKYGKKAAKYLIFVICEGNGVSIGNVIEVLRLTKGMKKELIVAVMDRQGEIVYYNLKPLNLIGI